MSENAASVEGEYTHSYMYTEIAAAGEEYVMYEIPENVDQVVIIPKSDNATFTYMDKAYSFGKVTDETRGELKLASAHEGTVGTNASFQTYEGDPVISSPFADVFTDAYYYDAVAWAVAKGITAGTSATTFSPNVSCTRAQTVTFLWRAAGSPAPKSAETPFTDVQPGTYYYDAVLWAVENGITAGTSATTFSPDATVTRAQTVTFLYRAADSPAAVGKLFTDIPSDAYYTNAVWWAVSKEVTAGTSETTFSPDAPCTRAQIVTFLYRDRAS